MPTCPVFTDQVGLFYTACDLDGVAVTELPALKLWYDAVKVGRAVAGSPLWLVIGDSVSEGVGIEAGNPRQRWVDRVQRRLQAGTPGGPGFLPASTNIFNLLGLPWTYTGGVVGEAGHGYGFHSATVPVTGTASISWFGDFLGVHGVVTTGGPTALVPTIDGVTGAPLDYRNTPESESFSVQIPPSGYGHHTISFDPNDGPWVLEGVTPIDSDFFFIPINTPWLLDGTHSGFNTEIWGDAGSFPFFGGPEWANGFLQNLKLLVVQLGTNDQGGVPVQDFEDNLVRIVQRADAKVATGPFSVLFVIVPGVLDRAYYEAAARAAVRVGTNRAVALDLAALLPDRKFGPALSNDPDPFTHPNLAGNQWLADRLGPLLDPLPPNPVPTTPGTQTHLATETPTARVNWAANIITSGGATFDQSPAGTTQAERRRRVWLDPGTYQATIHYQQDAGLGTIEVLIGRTTDLLVAELVSCGSVATAGALANLSQVLGTTVVNDAPGWHPIYVRKTTASGAVRFIQVVLDKIA